VKVIAIMGGTKMSGTLNFLYVAKTLRASRVLPKPFEKHISLKALPTDLLA
jgi:hypothetical protein